LRRAVGGPDYVRAAVVDVSIPPTHVAGRIDYDPSGDPRRSFAIPRARDLGGPDGIVRAALADLGPGEDVHVFVHGYNNTAAEALFRHAQMAHDFGGGAAGPQITFHWPSAARALGYVADRDATLAARNDLADLLSRLTARAPGRVVLVGHSMGAFLSMEALMRMEARRSGAVARLGRVALVSPYISIDVFLSQLDVVGPRPDAFVVVTSQADRVLGLSARLSGQPERLGTISDTERLRGRGIGLVDLTAFAGRGDAHLTAATSPGAIALIRGLVAESDRNGAAAAGLSR
jgi:esterase/lipase superfamily enzyme